MVDFINDVRSNMIHAIQREDLGLSNYLLDLPENEREFCRDLYENDPNVNVIKALDYLYN